MRFQAVKELKINSFTQINSTKKLSDKEKAKFLSLFLKNAKVFWKFNLYK